ncbi:MAG: propanediol utilization protein [Bacilli bacterium]|nr:propanediol utilization protein [Bacilli bacterium]
MYHKVKVAVSNRHVHLTKETYDLLFDEPITKKNDLNQKGQFAANETLTISNGENKFENVRIVAPFRSYNQVEISKNDARKLGLNPPVRTSGDLDNSETITLSTPKATITLDNACIIADRHVHFNTSDKEKYGIENGDKLKVHILGEKRGTIEVFAKVSDDGYYELHIDTDDANAFLLNTGDELVLEVYK